MLPPCTVIPVIVSKPAETGDEKTFLTKFGTEILLRVGIIEGATVICYAFYLLSQNGLILIAGIGLVSSLFFLRPSHAHYRAWRDWHVT